MRKIERIFVHATATPRSHTVEQVLNYFKRVKGWKAPGYHIMIDARGVAVFTFPLDKIANGVRGYNSTSVHVAWIGGIDARGKAIDNRTADQRTALRSVVLALKAAFPDAQLMGHRDISPDINGNGIVDPWERIKECPCFDVLKEYSDIVQLEPEYDKI